METEAVGVAMQTCLHGGTREHWEKFIAMAQPLLASAIWRSLSRSAPASRDLVDDLVQETFLRLCANDFHALRTFRGGDDTALQAYLRTIAASVAIDYVRSRASAKRGAGKDVASLDDMESVLGSHDANLEALERRQLLDRVERCLEKQEPRNRRIFWLYHAQGLTPRLIAALPEIGLGVGGVETLVYRLTGLVRECLRRAGLLQAARISEGGRA